MTKIPGIARGHHEAAIRQKTRPYRRSFFLTVGMTSMLPIALATAAAAAPAVERLRGTVSSIDATTVVVHTETGDQSVTLTPGTHFLEVKKASLGDIAAGSFIGTATKSVGSTAVALEVVIFPPAMKGTGEGHYPWDKIKDTTVGGMVKTNSSMTNGNVATIAPRPPAMVNSSMTNGNVSAVAGASGAQQLTVTYKGGQQTIIVPPTAPIVTFAPGTMQDVKPGQTIFLFAMKDGQTVTANAVAVGVDGATPPM